MVKLGIVYDCSTNITSLLPSFDSGSSTQKTRKTHTQPRKMDFEEEFPNSRSQFLVPCRSRCAADLRTGTSSNCHVCSFRHDDKMKITNAKNWSTLGLFPCFLLVIRGANHLQKAYSTQTLGSLGELTVWLPASTVWLTAFWTWHALSEITPIQPGSQNGIPMLHTVIPWMTT